MGLPSCQDVRENVERWLRQGTSPRQLAFTLALGIAIGCLPVVGAPTVICAALAFTLRLNLPAIQAANYAAMPLQLALVLPFIRLGRWFFAAGRLPVAAGSLHLGLASQVAQIGWLTSEALFGWLLVATPAVALMSAGLYAALRRLPLPSEAPAIRRD